MGANVNIYMMHGGTSFGFEAGANSPPFAVTPTSYDYDAPISEAGDLTRKYEVLKSVVEKYVNSSSHLATNRTNPTKAAYGKIQLKPLGDVFSQLDHLTRFGLKKSVNPLTFEDLGQTHGFVLYETVLNFTCREAQKSLIFLACEIEVTFSSTGSSKPCSQEVARYIPCR